MRKTFYLITTLLITFSIIVGCRVNDKLANRSCESNYPCLYLDTASITRWQNLDSFDAYIFDPFDSDTTNSWSLVVYGQDLKPSLPTDTLSNNDSIAFQVNPRVLSISNQTIEGYVPIDSTNMVFGNLSINGELFRQMINSGGGNCIYFIPTIDSVTFRHLTYIVHSGNRSPKTGIITPVKFTDRLLKLIKRYKETGRPHYYNIYPNADGEDEIILNPCPPAHMAIE